MRDKEFFMPAVWTGDFIKNVHLNGLTIKAVANRAGLNEKYVSQVLHSNDPSEKAKEKLFSALEELENEKRSKNKNS